MFLFFVDIFVTPCVLGFVNCRPYYDSSGCYILVLSIDYNHLENLYLLRHYPSHLLGIDVFLHFVITRPIWWKLA